MKGQSQKEHVIKVYVEMTYNEARRLADYIAFTNTNDTYNKILDSDKYTCYAVQGMVDTADDTLAVLNKALSNLPE